MKRNYTRLEKELLDVLNSVTFYVGHSEYCHKNWYHNYDLECTCEQGMATIRANTLLRKHGMGYYQREIDRVLS